MKGHASDELDILDYWDTHDVFRKSVEQRPEDQAYVFYDGPPFATGLPHYGHIVASVMKDAIPRFFAMRGQRVERTWGWDCHGLPIENIIEQEKGLKSRKDIEDFGIREFNAACHDTVLTYAEEWKKTVRRLGRWVDMENSYKTMDLPYMESIWWVFKSLWDKGLVYEGYKPMHVCPRCETALSNFEVNQNYAEVKDLSAYVMFPLTSGPHVGTTLVAWTTTPWTLPGNVLIAVGTDIEYVKVASEGKGYIFGKDAWERLKAEKEFPLADAEFIATMTGAELIDATYEPIVPTFADRDNAFRVVAGDFVTTDEGTGIVHIAPGFGEDDMKLGEAEGVVPVLHVQMNGQFIPELAGWMKAQGIDVEGKPVKTKGDTMAFDVEMVKLFAKLGRLLWKKKFEHNYPLCWRCDTPLLNYATTSWFVRVSEIRDRMAELNGGIHWVPEHIKEGRFGRWLAEARDWAVSRSRYWGTPLPIWRAEDGETLCIGSVEELRALSGTGVADLHKHVVDGIEIEKDGKKFRRVPEVLDCWFESGSMPYAQLHYPFENETKFAQGFPAEFIAEGQDQTRGWFYTLHVLAAALFDSPAYKNVIVNGIVLAEDGKKMSKRLKNYPDPMDVMERYGADAVRFYLMSSPVVTAENLRFSEKGVDEVSKKFVTILRNVVSFYELYEAHDDGRKPNGLHVLDTWILARLQETLRQETEAMERYDLIGASRPLQEFVTDLSQWYVRRSRERVKDEGEDRAEALATLRTVLETFAKMIAPFMPFLAEHTYQAVAGDFEGGEERLSVHLEDWPEINEQLFDEKGIADMARTRDIVSRALERRAAAGMNVRQPLATLEVAFPDGGLTDGYASLIRDEVNVKEVVFKDAEKLAVELDTELTPELMREGIVREITRRVNGMRKAAGLTIDDRIELFVASDDEEVRRALEEHHEDLVHGTLALTFRGEGEAPENAETFEVHGKGMTVGFAVAPPNKS